MSVAIDPTQREAMNLGHRLLCACIVFVAGCDPPVPLPVVSSTPRVVVRTRHPELACSTAAEPIEAYVDYLESEFGAYRAVVTPMIDVSVFLQSSEMPRDCSDFQACAVGTSISQTGSSWLPHELVHAVAHQYGESLPLLEEGLATYVDPGGWLGSSVDKSVDLPTYADSTMLRNVRASDPVLYARVVTAAASLTSFIIETRTLATFLAVYDALGDGSSVSDLSTELTDQTGTTLDAWISAWRLDAASDAVRTMPRSFACSQAPTANGTPMPLDCGVHPVTRTGLTQGAYASTQLVAPGVLALSFSPNATGPSSRLTSCDDGSLRGTLFGFEPTRHLHLYDVSAGSVGAEVDSITSGAATFTLQETPAVMLDVCQENALTVEPGLTVHWSLADTGTSHPGLGAASGVHLIAAEASSIRVAAPDEGVTYFCDASCSAATSCNSIANLKDAAGVVSVSAGESFYLVVPRGAGRTTIVVGVE